MPVRIVFALVFTLCLVRSGIAQQPQPAGTGPYPAIAEADAGLSTHMVYRPANLGPFGAARRLPIVAWANGGCSNNSRGFAPFLTEIASHGFLVVAIGPADGTGNNTKSTQLLDGVDWASRENGRSGSQYAGKVDPSKVAVMGQSCGGLQALEVAPDPRVTTTVLWNSGVLNAARPAGGPVMPVTIGKDALDKLQSPTAYFIGGKEDVAYPNAVDDFARINRVPVFMANINVGHGGTYRESNGGVMGVAGVAWLKWQLKGDGEAQKMFVGAACGLCTDSRWTVEQKLTTAR